ncbi:MAG: LacI family DNA-binding transcriptional regulator [Acidimicrobiia bacterium]
MSTLSNGPQLPSGGPAPASRASMRDVAALANVSLKTVSRTINSEPSVKTETAARVMRAVSMLGYERNDLARSLRNGRATLALGLVISDVSNRFFALVARGVEEIARENGYIVISGNSDEDPLRERDIVSSLTRRRIDALLIVPTSSDQAHLSRARATIPVAFIDRPAIDGGVDTVLLDNAEGARGAIKRLIDRGHERIGVVTGPMELYTYQERLAGYRRALADAGLPVDESLIRVGAHDADEAEAATRELLAGDKPPTALFATNNQMTIGAIKAIADRPEDIETIGFDDFELADLVSVRVTTLAHDPSEMGREAARLVLNRLRGETGPPRLVVLPTRLMVREE